MMSVPALALFYGGMVRSKNMLDADADVRGVLADHRAVVHLSSTSRSPRQPFFGGSIEYSSRERSSPKEVREAAAFQR
jgi:hypothetical protein